MYEHNSLGDHVRLNMGYIIVVSSCVRTVRLASASRGTTYHDRDSIWSIYSRQYRGYRQVNFNKTKTLRNLVVKHDVRCKIRYRLYHCREFMCADRALSFGEPWDYVP